MKRLFVVGVVAAGAAACNTSQTGNFGNIAFTPVQCGQPADGCDFADAIGVGGRINVQISGLDGTPTAGLDLASRDPDRLAVAPSADIDGAPAWELTGLQAGLADLAAVDDAGSEIDFIEVAVEDLVRLTMDPFVGDVVGPVAEDPYDEAFTVNADQAASWFIRPVIADDTTTMGRYQFASSEPVDLSQYEAENSDRANGYFYVILPPGDHAIEFELADDPDIFVSAIIHAQ